MTFPGWRYLPNALTVIRIAGSPVLILLAAVGAPTALAATALFLVFTEWADGFLARRLHVDSPLGARLDTIADAVFYSCLLISLVLLRPALVAAETAWIAVAVGSYSLSWIASWLKFGKLPSYHTWAAKGVWVVVLFGIAWLVLGWGVWPFRAAMLCVTVANLEAVLITQTLSEPAVDIPTIFHARRREESGPPPHDGPPPHQQSRST